VEGWCQMEWSCGTVMSDGVEPSSWSFEIIKSKVVPVRAMKACGGLETTVSVLFWRSVFKFTLQPLYLQGKTPWYPLNRAVWGAEPVLILWWREKTSCLCWGLNRYSRDIHTLSYCTSSAG
jgi:hypothetical protein